MKYGTVSVVAAVLAPTPSCPRAGVEGESGGQLRTAYRLAADPAEPGEERELEDGA